MKFADPRREAALYDIPHDAHRGHASFAARHWKLDLNSLPGSACLQPVVYDEVAVERHRWARLTLEAHLIKLARECRASERDGLWRPSHP